MGFPDNERYAAPYIIDIIVRLFIIVAKHHDVVMRYTMIVAVKLLQSVHISISLLFSYNIVEFAEFNERFKFIH